MSEMTSGTMRARARAREEAAAEEVDGVGWLTFAATLLGLAGIVNVVYGIAAVDGARVYAGDVEFVFGNLETWGWLLLLVGAVQAVTALFVWRRSEAARWVAVALVVGNAVLQLLWLPAYPFLSAALLGLDLLMLYALVAYAGRDAVPR